jgi:hypothetical protein
MRTSVDVGIGQAFGNDVLLTPPSAAEPRVIDSGRDENDLPHGIPAHDEEKNAPPVSAF